MKVNYQNIRFSLIVFMLVSSLLTTSSAQKPAELVPNFIFYKFDNTPFTNKNLATGKETLFVFFDVTCDHCRQTIETLSSRIDECKQIAVYLITLDDKAAVGNFLKQYGKNLVNKRNVVILRDKKDQFITLFGPRKYPSIFLFSSQKKLLLYDDQDLKLEKFFKIINTSNHEIP